MPYATFLLLADVALVVHAARTGRFTPWAYVIMFLPGVGAAAYVVVELLPEWLGTYKGRQAQISLARTINPTKRYRELKDDLAIVDTISNRVALARECLLLEKFDEAHAILAELVKLPQGDEPTYYMDKARAEFGLKRFGDAVQTLDDLRKHWPDYQSSEGHLLYACALGAAGREQEALAEYRALSNYYPGPEPRARIAQLLLRTGHADEAKREAEAIVLALRRSPRHVVKAQKEWLTAAEAILKK
jgi:hypothetical protein